MQSVSFESPDPDWSLLEKFRQGDSAAFRELFNKHKNRVIQLSHRFVQNQEAAEDIAQDVFIKIYEKRLGFEPRARFSTWLYRVTVNASLDFLRKKKFHGRSLDETFSGGNEGETIQAGIGDPKASFPDQTLINEERGRLVQNEVQLLPESLRLPLLLYQFEEMPYREIAKILCITEKAVERRLYHAKEVLREKLSKYFVD